MKNKYLKKIIFFFLLIPVIGFAQGLEVPTCDPSDIVDHGFYKIKYNETTEQADWAAYELTHEDLTGKTSRRDNFRADPAIVTGSAQLEDYRGSGFDRGHLVPAGDMKMSKESMSASFYLSNISPQFPDFNRGIWLELENHVRTWAWEYGSVFIVTGPLFDKDELVTIGPNDVAIPDHFFKVVLDYSSENIKALGFILPNESIKEPLQSFIVSVDYVELVSGLDFFYLLDDNIEEGIESEVDIQSWKWKEFSFLERNTVQERDAETFKYWINTGSNTRHNPSCQYYGNTKNGYYTNQKTGKACGRCGG